MKSEPKHLSEEELLSRAARFFERYKGELENIRASLHINLQQLALAYTIEQHLPPEAITISSRVKSHSSFVKKLKKKNFPQFYYPTEIAGDLVGARVVCWFVDDCNGMVDVIQKSTRIHIAADVEDYISNPKDSGYRSIHLNSAIDYDAVRRDNGEVHVSSDQMNCEIQVRSKLQDAWGDLTHEFHYKALEQGVTNRTYERILSEISDRLSNEDRSLITLRNAYQELADEKLASDAREGFKS